MNYDEVVEILSKVSNESVERLKEYIASNNYGLELRSYPNKQSSVLINYINLVDLVEELSE